MKTVKHDLKEIGMKNAEIKIGDKVKAGLEKRPRLPRQYVEGVVDSFGLNKVVIKCLDNGEEVLKVALKKHCILVEAA